MPNKTPRYHDRRSHDRLLLLIAVIAQNPGIGSIRQCNELAKNRLEILAEAMAELAIDQGIEIEPWSIHTIGKDIGYLKERGILPKKPSYSGYAIGRRPTFPDAPSKPETKELRQQVLNLKAEGLSQAAIGRKLSLSRQRVHQLIHMQD